MISFSRLVERDVWLESDTADDDVDDGEASTSLACLLTVFARVHSGGNAGTGAAGDGEAGP